MRALKFITGHVIVKLHYNQIYQLKTTHICTVQTFSAIIIFQLSDHSNEMICHFQSCFSMPTLCLKGERDLPHFIKLFVKWMLLFVQDKKTYYSTALGTS